MARPIADGAPQPGLAGAEPAANPDLPWSVAYTLDPFNGSLIGGLYSPPVPGMLEGIAYDPTSDSLLVGDADGGPIYQMNASSGQGIRAIGTGPNPYGVNNDPAVLFYDQRSNTLYVAITTTGLVRFINATTGQLLGSVTEGYSASAFAYDTATGVLYISNFGANNVTLLDTSDNRMLATNITVCNEATSEVWVPSNRELFVTCVDTEEVLVINTTSEQVVKHLLIGGSSAANVYPDALAYDPTNGYVYVANQQASNVSIIDPTTNSFVGTGISTHGYSPESLLYDPPSGSVLVGTLPSGLVVIDTSNNSLSSMRIPTGNTPASLAYDSTDQQVYVVNSGDDTLTQVSAANGSVLRGAIPLMFRLLGDTYDAANQRIYVATPDENFACVQPGNLIDINASGDLPSLTKFIPVGLGPEAPTVDVPTGRLFVPNYCSDTVSALNGSDDHVLSDTLPAGLGPIAGADDPSTGTVFIANGNSNNVTSLNASTLAPILTNVSVGVQPDAVAFDTRTNTVFVANFGSDNVTRLNATTGLVVGTAIPVGTEPDAMLYDSLNDRIYVANYGSNNVTVVNATSGGTVVAGVSVASGPIAMDLDGATNSICIADAGSGAMSILNATTNSLIGSPIRVGAEPEGVAYDPVHNAVFGSDYASGAIVVLATIPFGVSLAASSNPGEVGRQLTLSTEVGNGSAPYSYSYTGLPSGCASQNTSWLACVPQRAGNYSVQVSVTNSFGGYAAYARLALTIVDGPQILAAQATPALLEVGSSTTLEVTAGGGLGLLTIEYSNLPPGCTSSNTTALSCRPTQVGEYAILVNATDTIGASYSATISLAVVPALTLAAFYAIPNPVAVGSNLTIAAIPEGGVSPFTLSFSGLPPGCASANSTELNCAPTQGGNFTIRLHLTDSSSGSLSANVSIQVVSLPPPSLHLLAFLANPSSIPLGATTTLVVVADGGSGSLDFAYSGLPSGCATASTANLTCAPMGAGQFTVHVTVTDTLGSSVTGSTPLIVTAVSSIKNATGAPGSGPPWLEFAGVGGVGLIAGAGVAWVVTRARAKRGTGERVDSATKAPGQ